MLPFHQLTRLLPYSFDCTGKHLPAVCNVLKNILPLPRLCKLPAGITADTDNPGEGLLSLFFFNIIQYYKNSPLYRYMKNRLKQGDVFLDIGAYLGIYGYLAHGLGATPVLFEANPACISFLKRNRHLFYNTYPFAAWHEKDERDYFIGKDNNLGASSLIQSLNPWESCCYKSKITVECRSLASILPAHLWDRISLVKIDVEGAEDNVLKGFGDKLGKYGYHIWCEARDSTSDRNPGSFGKVCDLALKFGYSINFYDGTEVMPIQADHIGRVFDLLLIPAR